MALFAVMFSEDVTSPQEAGAASDSEGSSSNHDVALLGAPARSNASSPPDGASEERLCKRQRTSRGPTGGSAISMPDLGRSDNASATGTPARGGHNSPHSLGDSIHPVGASSISPGRITSAEALRFAQSARSSPLSRCAENIDSSLSVAAQRRRVYSHAAGVEEARLLSDTDTERPVSKVTRRVYEHLKAGRARPDSVDYLPKPYDAKTNKRNKEYSYLDSLRRLAREDKLGEADFQLISLLPGNLQRILGDRGLEYFGIAQVAGRMKSPLSQSARSSPLSITRKVYEHLKAETARPDSEDYLPTFKDAKTNKLNLKYSFLQSLRRHARADKLGPRSLPPLKFPPLLLNKLHKLKP